MDHPELHASITRPRPLDEKLAQGVAIWEGVTLETIDSVVASFQDSLEAQKFDESREYGSCVAFAVEIDPVEEADVDEALIQAAHDEFGIRTLSFEQGVEAVSDSLRPIWIGETSSRRLSLRKFVGHVLMEDYSIQEGIVYTFCARDKKDEETEK